MCQLIPEQGWRGELVRIQTTWGLLAGALQEVLSPHPQSVALGRCSSALSVFPGYPGELQHPQTQTHTTLGCVAAPTSLWSEPVKCRKCNKLGAKGRSQTGLEGNSIKKCWLQERSTRKTLHSLKKGMGKGGPMQTAPAGLPTADSWLAVGVRERLW